jgi:formylglycine-generating enzyme required for sulfatase activity
MAQVPVAFRNPKDDYDMILVPAGDAIIGSDENDPDASADERPQITVDLPAYYLGLYAVTNEQYREFVRATGHRTPGPPNWSKPVWDGLSFPREVANHPVVCVSLADAAAYCEWAGLRLPTEIEWEKAARGADGRVFPWGNEWDPSRCHSSANKGTRGTCPVHDPRYEGGRSYWGHYQMAGNTWEWTWGRYDPRAYEKYLRGEVALPLPWVPVDGDYVSVRGGR